MKWGLWSTTASSNSSTPPDGWPEGQLPSTVNDCAREMMAAIKTGILDIAQGFIDIGQSPTFVTATTFTTPTNDLSYMPVGSRLRFNVGSSTLYGTVSSASYSTNTGITVALDSGSLTASLSSMAIGVSGTRGGHFDTTVSISASATGLLTLTNAGGAAAGMWLRCSAGAKLVYVNSSSNFVVTNSANSVGIMQLTDAGAVTFSGNVTAFSDERLKDNWKPLPFGVVHKMAAMIKSGTFDRTDIGGRFVGVGAQSLRDVIPEAVVETDSGLLAVDYGPAALALCVELCREIGYLQGRLAKLEHRS